MAEDKKSFILYADLLKVVEKLPDDIAGKLFKIILKYVNDVEVPIDDILLEIAFEPIKNQLKRDLKKYKKAVDKKSESGQLGNLKRWNVDLYEKVINKKISLNEALNVAKHRSAIKPIANVAVNDTVTDNDTVTVTDNVILLEKETKEKYIQKDFNQTDSKSQDPKTKSNSIKTEKEKRKKVAPKKENFTKSDFKKRLLEFGVNETHLNDWCTVRDKHKAPYTQTVLSALMRECEEHNFPVAKAVQISAERGWRSFKVEWTKNNFDKNGKPNKEPNNYFKQANDLIDKFYSK